MDLLSSSILFCARVNNMMIYAIHYSFCVKLYKIEVEGVILLKLARVSEDKRFSVCQPHCQCHHSLTMVSRESNAKICIISHLRQPRNQYMSLFRWQATSRQHHHHHHCRQHNKSIEVYCML